MFEIKRSEFITLLGDCHRLAAGGARSNPGAKFCGGRPCHAASAEEKDVYLRSAAYGDKILKGQAVFLDRLLRVVADE
jgi:hypothetical protein